VFLNPKAHQNGGELVLSRKHRDENIEVQKGKMSVAEAGRKGGAKGGPRVRELIREGKQYEEEWE
jgi:hypothetical protein